MLDEEIANLSEAYRAAGRLDEVVPLEPASLGITI
jgi:hypothetical protein